MQGLFYDRALGVKREIAADIVDEHSYLEFLNEHPSIFLVTGAVLAKAESSLNLSNTWLCCYVPIYFVQLRIAKVNLVTGTQDSST